ncbi:MAG: extensin family protein [Erythrobacter sp.]|nr:extensin family protein [Erythrobacter sp.]
MAGKDTGISTRIGRFAGDRRVIGLLLVLAAFIGGRAWLAEHPEHDPWAPLDLRDPPGWATTMKLQALRDDVPACRAVLERSDVVFTALDAQGEGACARPDRTRLDDYPLSPASPPTTCPVAIAMQIWRTDTLEPAAQDIFGSKLQRLEHLGAYSCRRLYGRDSGAWSEHATGNAIDIGAFVLEDGTRISVLGDWEGDDDQARFLRRARDGACNAFATTLSPDYNAAHADHFHLDMSPRWSGVCR